MEQEKRDGRCSCMHNVRVNPLLTFENKAQEHAFKKSYQAELPMACLVYGTIWLVIAGLCQIPLYRQQCQDGFAWSLNDPRTLYFGSKAIACGFSIAICFISRLPPRAARFFNLEIIVFVLTTLHLTGTIFLTPLRLAIYFNADFDTTWPNINHTTSEYEMLLVLALIVQSTIITQFLSIRVRILWIQNASIVIIYTASMVILGVPLSPGIARSMVGIQTAMIALAWCGAWRNESYAREKWLMMQTAVEDLHNANISVDEVHKAFVNEKVKRFNAEHCLQQVQGGWHQAASAAIDVPNFPPPPLSGPVDPVFAGDDLSISNIVVEEKKKGQFEQPLKSRATDVESVLSSIHSLTGSTTSCIADGDCLPPGACVWVEGKENPVPLKSVQPGMRVATVQHSPGNPVAFAPVQTISVNAADGAKAPVWLRVVLTDGSEAIMTADHCVVPHSSGKQARAVRAQDLMPGIDSLMVMSTRPTPVQSISQLPADEVPLASVWLEVAGCEKAGEQGESRRSVLVSMPPPKSDRPGAFVAVGDAQVAPGPEHGDSQHPPVPMTNSSFSDCTSEGKGARSIPSSIPRTMSGITNGSGGKIVILHGGERQKGWAWQKPNGPWQRSSSVSSMPLDRNQNLLPGPTPVGGPLDQCHQLQVKNTFLDVVSQPGSEQSSEKKPWPWTDERAGLVYGSYPQPGASPRMQLPRTPSPRTPTVLSGSKTDSISSRSRISEMSSSEGSAANATVVVLGGKTPSKGCGEVYMSEFQQVPRHPTTGETTSLGSAGHFHGNCKPCEWIQRGRPCKYGWRCEYCHIVDDHARYSRKSRQSAGSFQKRNCGSALTMPNGATGKMEL